MATPQPDSYTSVSGTPINAGRYAVTDYAATAVMSTDAGADANPGDTLLVTVDINSTGAQAIGNAQYTAEILDGNLTLVNGSGTATGGGVVTQDDTRIQVDYATLSGASQVTYQVLVSGNMATPGYISMRGLLIGDQIAPLPTNLIVVDVVAAPAGPTPLPGWNNADFETDVLTPGQSTNPANADSYTHIYAENIQDSYGTISGDNVGTGDQSGTGGTNTIQQTVTRDWLASEYYILKCNFRYRDTEGEASLTTNTYFPRSTPTGQFRLRRCYPRLNTPGNVWGCGQTEFALSSDQLGATLGFALAQQATQLILDDFQILVSPTWRQSDLSLWDEDNKQDVVIGAALVMEQPYLTTGNGTFLNPPDNSNVKRIVECTHVRTDQAYWEQATASRQPIYRAPNKIEWDGVDDQMTRRYAVGDRYAAPWTALFRMQLLTTNTALKFLWDSSSNQGIYLKETGELSIIFRDGGNEIIDLIPNFSTTYLNQDVVVVVHNESGNTFGIIYGDTPSPSASTTTTGFYLHRTGVKPHCLDWGICVYEGWDVQKNQDIYNFLMSL